MFSAGEPGADDAPRQGHKQSSRHAFVGYIGDDDAQVARQRDKVVEIAAHLPGGFPARCKIPAAMAWYLAWEQACLDLARHLEFPFQAALFHGNLVQTGVLNGDGGAGSDGGDQFQVGLGEDAGPQRIVYVNDAGNLVLDLERGAHQRAQLQALYAGSRVETIILQRVAAENGLSLAGYRFDDAPRDLKLRFVNATLVYAARRAEDQAAIRLAQCHEAALGAGGGNDFIHHAVEHFVQIEQRVKCLRQVIQKAEAIIRQRAGAG